MRSPALPASLYSSCPACGAPIAPHIPDDDFTCPKLAAALRDIARGHLPNIPEEPTDA